MSNSTKPITPIRKREVEMIFKEFFRNFFEVMHIRPSTIRIQIAEVQTKPIQKINADPTAKEYGRATKAAKQTTMLAMRLTTCRNNG